MVFHLYPVLSTAALYVLMVYNMCTFKKISSFQSTFAGDKAQRLVTHFYILCLIYFQICHHNFCVKEGKVTL